MVLLDGYTGTWLWFAATWTPSPQDIQTTASGPAAVSFFIVKVSVQLLKPCIDELTEKSLPDEVEEQIGRIVEAIPGVSALHNLRTRRIGNHYAIEMHVRMDGHLTLYEAHAKASDIERQIKEQFGKDTHVGIHVEPVKDANGQYAE